MEKENFLEFEKAFNGDGEILSIVRWWEKKRLTFTLVLLATEVIMMSSNIQGTIEFGISNAIIGSLAYTIVANGFFCLGWGLEVLIKYYKGGDFLEQFRWFFLALGVLFSCLYTIILYHDTLSYYPF